MPIPKSDLDRIHAWCQGKVPPEMQDRVRIEADVAARHVTIVEVHADRDGFAGAPRTPVVRLRYTGSTNQWSIYWCDRNGDFHVYGRRRPDRDIDALLGFIDVDPDALFWG